MVTSAAAVRRRGFTLVEALTAITVCTLAGAAVVLALNSAYRSNESMIQWLQAQGLAEQLADEIAGKRYHAVGVGPEQWPLGAGRYEGPSRSQYDDIDDFARYSAGPPVDRWDIAVGEGDGQGGWRPPALQLDPRMFQSWLQQVRVYYVNPNDWSQELPPGQTSRVRALEVRIRVVEPDGTVRTLAEVRRVFAYVPPP